MNLSCHCILYEILEITNTVLYKLIVHLFRGDDEELLDSDLSYEFHRESHHIHSIPRPQISQVRVRVRVKVKVQGQGQGQGQVQGQGQGQGQGIGTR